MFRRIFGGIAKPSGAVTNEVIPGGPHGEPGQLLSIVTPIVKLRVVVPENGTGKFEMIGQTDYKVQANGERAGVTTTVEFELPVEVETVLRQLLEQHRAACITKTLRDAYSAVAHAQQRGEL